MWDKVGVIAGVISAICAVISIPFVARPQVTPPGGGRHHRALSSNKFFAFVLASSGWSLAVLCFVWVVQPYGPYLTQHDYRQIAGIILGLPALILFASGVRHLQRKQ
jgi:hypothetical protein